MKKILGLTKVLAKAEDGPRLEELVSHFFQVAGGAKKMAQLLYEEFLAAPTGSLMRQRILEMILRSARYTTGDDMGDMSMVSDEDLQKVAAQAISAMPVTNGEEEGRSSGPAQSPDAAHAQAGAHGGRPKPA